MNRLLQNSLEQNRRFLRTLLEPLGNFRIDYYDGLQRLQIGDTTIVEECSPLKGEYHFDQSDVKEQDWKDAYEKVKEMLYFATRSAQVSKPPEYSI